jgi:hypothetical protein
MKAHQKGFSHTRAIKKTLRHNANEIRPSFTPVGYSIPSALVIIFVNSAWASLAIDVAVLVLVNPLSAGAADEEPCCNSSASPSAVFSSILRDVLFRVSEAESSVGISFFSSCDVAIPWKGLECLTDRNGREKLSKLTMDVEVDVDVGTLGKPFLMYRAGIMWLRRLVGPGVREIYGGGGGLLESWPN